MEFTYLIGAGASAQTIPITKDFPKQLYDFAEKIKSHEITIDKPIDPNNDESRYSKVRERLYSDIRWLAKECNSHASIDTFAKKLYLSDRKEELIKLKGIVSEFLIYVQQIKGIDKRYDAFFASLLDKSDPILTLPKNIKILSWNYDKQIEYSIAQFIKSSDNDIIENLVQICPGANRTSTDEEKFCLYKLNGSVGGLISENKKYSPIHLDYLLFGDRNTDKNKNELIEYILFRYYHIELRALYINHNVRNVKLQEFPTVMYSWEKNEVFESVRTNALAATKNTNILIIIGYSFPTFNRNMDKAILKNMRHLQKVFIQSKEDDIKGVTQRFKSLYDMGISINEVSDVNEFYIPFEF